MKSSFTILALVASQAVASNIFQKRTPPGPGVCVADNCSRGVNGVNGAPARTSRLADCTSFQAITVTPAVTTTTVTITTTLAPVKRDIEARQVTVSPSSVPAYATYCKSPSAYKSACSCAGVTEATVTAPTPTSTVYATATVTPPPVCPGKTSCPSGCADLTQDNNNCGACGNKCEPPYVCGQSKCVLPAIYQCDTQGNSFPGCGGSCGGTCFTYVGASGDNGVCKVSLPCAGLQPCSTGADCASSYCLVNACGSVCAGTPFLCPTANNPKMLFARKPVAHIEGRAIVETEVGPVDQ